MDVCLLHSMNCFSKTLRNISPFHITIQIEIEIGKCRYFTCDSHLGSQDSRRRRIHWAMAVAPLHAFKWSLHYQNFQWLVNRICRMCKICNFQSPTWSLHLQFGLQCHFALKAKLQIKGVILFKWANPGLFLFIFIILSIQFQ